MSDQERFAGKKRFAAFAVILGLIVTALLIRYGVLMLGPHEAGRTTRNEVSAGRGLIMDRNGRILAMETRLGNVSLWRPEMKDSGELSRELAPLLEIPAEEIQERIENAQSDFIYLKKQVEDSSLKLIETAIAGGKLRGVSIEPIVGRIYPERNLASQIIGFTGNENTGLAGIEYAFERELAPAPGGGLVSRGGAGQNGSQIFLTLDINVQYILESIAGQILRDSGAEAVMFMAMDPRNGDILGSASVPGFDPNDFRASDDNSRMDRPAIWAYEPGSVFKVFSLSALMDSNAIGGNSTFICNGLYERVPTGANG